jgi:hypothetical protein
MQMKIINEKIKKNIQTLSKAVNNEIFADRIDSDRFEELQHRFEENSKI